MFEESRGRRDKHWLADPDGNVWLGKMPRGWQAATGRFSEPIIEAFTLHLASLLGLPVAEGRIARLVFEGGDSIGFISRRFTDESNDLIDGALMAAVFDEDYKKAYLRQQQALLVARTAPEAEKIAAEKLANAAEKDVRVMSTLTRALEAAERWSVLEEFFAQLVFDAWVGNADRHAANWGIIIAGPKTPDIRLAPMFDTAGCLATEVSLDAEAARLGDVDSYIARCNSGFGDGVSKTNTLMSDVITQLKGHPCWGSVGTVLVEKIRDLAVNVDSLLAGDIPLMSQKRRNFVVQVLTKRVTLLL